MACLAAVIYQEGGRDVRGGLRSGRGCPDGGGFGGGTCGYTGGVCMAPPTPPPPPPHLPSPHLSSPLLSPVGIPAEHGGSR